MSQYGYLMHHGVKGMRWGIRNYQNPDGTLTEAGRRRYGTVENFNKAQATRQKAGKVAKGLAIANAAALVTAGAGTALYLNRDNFKNAALKIPGKQMAKGNIDAAGKWAGRVYNKQQLSKFVSRNAETLANHPGSLSNRRTARAFNKFTQDLGNKSWGKDPSGKLTGNALRNLAKGNTEGIDKFMKATSGLEKGLKIIGAGTAAVAAVTGGIAAVKGIANTANNVYVTKDLPIVKEGARILNEKGYLKEDSPIYKWIVKK